MFEIIIENDHIRSRSWLNFIQVDLRRCVIPHRERVFRLLDSAEPYCISSGTPASGNFEGGIDEHSNIPEARDLSSLQEAAVDDQNRGSRCIQGLPVDWRVS